MVDYEYACKIYDEYNEQYTEGADAEDIIEEFENTDEADDYSEEVEGRWSKEDHEETVIHANNCLGGLTTAELKIVKIGVRAPDVWYTASRYNGKVKESNPYGLDLRMFHAIEDYNYVKVYEYDYNKNKWIHLTPTDARENKKAKGEKRFTYAKFAINKILNVWNKKNSPSFLEYNIQGHSNDFRLRGLYEFSLVSPNSVNFYSFEKDISKLSCPFTCNK